jgi:hypothetical protein
MTPERIATITGRARALVGQSAYCFATAQGRGLPPLTVVGPWPPFGDSRGTWLLGLSASMRVDADGGAWRYWLELGA